MSLIVYKYDAPLVENLVIDMPDGAQILSVAVQRGTPRIWALVDLGARLMPRKFLWLTTGVQVERIGRFIGTVQDKSETMVFHLFEAK